MWCFSYKLYGRLLGDKGGIKVIKNDFNNCFYFGYNIVFIFYFIGFKFNEMVV